MQAPFADPLSGIELVSRPLPLVGREAEMQLLCNMLDTVALDRAYGPRAMMLSGETGTGKTRLLAEMRQEAGQRDFYLLEGRAYEVGTSLPYMPFAEALRPVIRGSSLKRLRFLVGLDTTASGQQPGDADFESNVSISLVGPPLVAALARLFPELPHSLQLAITPEPLGADQEKFRAWDGGYGIRVVEVSTDGGKSWAEATLGPDAGKYALRTWTYQFVAQRGHTKVAARATNVIGQSQTAALIVNPAGYHHNLIQTVTVVAA